MELGSHLNMNSRRAMTSENNVEKKQKNFVLEKQSLQKGESSSATVTASVSAGLGARKKVKVKVKKMPFTEKKEANEAPLSPIDGSKRKVTAVSKKKDEKLQDVSQIVNEAKSGAVSQDTFQHKNDVPVSSFNAEANNDVNNSVGNEGMTAVDKETKQPKGVSDIQSAKTTQNDLSVVSHSSSNSVLNEPKAIENVSASEMACDKGISVESVSKTNASKDSADKDDSLDAKKMDERKHETSSEKMFDGKVVAKNVVPSEKNDRRQKVSREVSHSEKKSGVQNMPRNERKPNFPSSTSTQKHEVEDNEISACIIREPSAGSVSGEVQRKYSSIDELNKRPNIKAGNLSDGAKKYRYNKKTGDSKQKTGQFGDKKKDWAGGQRGHDEKKFGSSENRNRGDQGNKKQFGQGMRQVPTALPIEVQKQNKKTRGAKKDYSRKSKDEEFFEEKQIQQKKKTREKVSAVPAEIQILETISVAELAKKMNLRASEIISKLMENGMMVTVNQSIDSDTAQIIASDYGCDVKVVSLYEETIIESASDEGVELKSRPPIVTVMGHVDHGKTKTLDAIRSSNVASGEFGGITQHIGAYTVSYNDRAITFLDTPGHEAFTMMRARGASITDIVVLVVAADDGVMPQTIEAINHAKDAKVPIIVAINKMDKPEANPDKVKTRLSELDLMPEDWGGKTMYVEISALKKQGISDLLEAILLQAEVLELKANYDCKAEGKVLESKIDHGRGVVASVIVQRGVLKEGDAYVAGIYSGHVRAIFDDKGKRVMQALPSMPCEILGLNEMPNAGDPFQVTDNEKLARQISDKRRELKRFEVAKAVKKVTLDNLYDTIQEGSILELKVIIKADVQGSAEALTTSLEKLSTKEIRLNVIHASAGAINESDVMLATADSNVIIIGFNVRPTVKARLLAETEKVDIRKYTIIYQAVEEMKLAMEGMLSPDKKEVMVGSAEVRNVFKVSKVGNIAGIYVLDGNVKRSYLVNVIRDGVVLANSLKIASLKRFKDDVKEVAQGFECGLSLEGFNDIAVLDVFEFIEIQEVSRKLNNE